MPTNPPTMMPADTTALGALLAVTKLMQLLVENGVITGPEFVQVFKGAIADVADPQQQIALHAGLKAYLPNAGL